MAESTHEKEFYLIDYIEEKTSAKEEKKTSESNDHEEFYTLCSKVRHYIEDMWDEDVDEKRKIQKKAIQGYEDQLNSFLNKIDEYLVQHQKTNVTPPPWYDTLTEGIFHEQWGLAGVQKWTKLNGSSSCKVVGNRIYYLIDGQLKMQPQTLTNDRLDQLIDTLLVGKSKRLNEMYHEVELLDGTRIEIFNRPNPKIDRGAKEKSIVFRKYVVENFSFEEQAKRKTIPYEMIPLLENMVKCGFNVNFIGPPRSGKTTFLTTYQSYEDESLEGVQIETHPEVPLHVIMPFAPIIQLLVDNDDLKHAMKPLLRSDGDYFIVGEARDGQALKVMVDVTTKGTLRVKGTYHTGKPHNFAFDVAEMITSQIGGDTWSQMIRVAEGFHYLFHFEQMPYDKSKKKLISIDELRFDEEKLLISSNRIVHYNRETDEWEYKYDIGDEIERIGLKEDPQAFKAFKEELKELEGKRKMQIDNIRVSPYSRLMTGKMSGGGI